jgi:hypothetical protein
LVVEASVLSQDEQKRYWSCDGGVVLDILDILDALAILDCLIRNCEARPDARRKGILPTAAGV